MILDQNAAALLQQLSRQLATLRLNSNQQAASGSSTASTYLLFPSSGTTNTSGNNHNKSKCAMQSTEEVNAGQGTTSSPVEAAETNREDVESCSSQTILPRIQESLSRMVTDTAALSTTSNQTVSRSEYGFTYFDDHSTVREATSTIPSSNSIEHDNAAFSSVSLERNNNHSTTCNSAVPSHLGLDMDEHPTKDTNTTVDHFNVKLDVRYLENFTTRLKDTFLPSRNCNQRRCQNYRERLEQHNLLFHQPGSPPLELCQHQQEQFHQHVCQPQQFHPGPPKIYHTTGSDTAHLPGKVSSAHATQTIQPSKRDRGIEFQVPKTSFANQVQESSNQSVKLTKSTSVENFHNTDRSIATSVINSVLGDTSALIFNPRNVAIKGDEVDDGSTVNIIENSCSVSMKSFYLNPKNRNNQGTANTPIVAADTDFKQQTASPRLKLYEEQLGIEIYKWYNDVPVFPDQQESSKDFREYLVKSLIQRLVDNSHRVTDEGYGDIVRRFVENCVNNLPMWCPGDKDEQSRFKKRMGENLLEKILLLNEKVFDADHALNFDVRKSEITEWADDNYYSIAGTSKTTHVNNLKISEELGIEEMISLYVSHSINNDVIRIYPNYTKYDFMNLLFKALEPFLYQKSNITFAALSKKIFEILDELPVTICSDTDKALRLYKLSENLADLIRQHGALNDITATRKGSNTTCKSTISHSQFVSFIKVEVKDCLRRFCIETNEDVLNDISEVLAKELDTVSTGTKSEKPITTVYRLLKKTGVTKEELSAVVLSLINCARILPLKYQVQTCQGIGMDIKNSPISNTVIVLRNQTGNSKRGETPTSSTPNTTTKEPGSVRNLTGAYQEMPAQSSLNHSHKYKPFAPDVSSMTMDKDLPGTHKVPRLSPEASAYLDAVEIEIEKWMDALTELPFKTDEDLKFKRVMIKDLAADVLDWAKFKQINPKKSSNIEDLEHVRYIIFRWVWRISDVHSFVRDDQFDNKILHLVHQLHSVPVPDLITPYLGNRRDMKIAADQIPTGIDILADEISIFLNERAPDIFVDKNKSTRNRLIHELATNVKEHVINEENPAVKIDNAIDEWLQKAVKPETNRREIKSLLKEQIAKVPIKVFQPYAKTRSQVDLEEATADAMDWLKEQSFYQQCTPADKDHQETRTAAMVKSLLELNRLLPELPVFPLSAETKTNQILTEMVDHLKYFPLSNSKRMEQEYSFEQMKNFAKELVKRLSKFQKMRKLARSEAATPGIDDLVEEWLQLIPIKITTADAQVKFEGLKANLIASLNTLKNLQNERPANVHDNLLKSEIKNFLQNCPLDERVPNTEKGRLEKAQELIEIIKSIGEQSVERTIPPCVCPTPADQQLKDFLKENLQQFQTGDTIAKEAFTERLFKELEKVNIKPCEMQDCQLSCKDVTQQQNQTINMKRFNEELVIIKSISEWLKGLPLDDEFYSPQNQDRSKNISELAQKIYNVLSSSEPAGNLDLHLFQLILGWMPKIPIKREYQQQPMRETMSHALKNRIQNDLSEHHAAQANLAQEQQLGYGNANESSAREQDTRNNTQKLEDFVENFMTMNRNIEISDEVIRDAYAYKLLQALKIAIKHLKEPTTNKSALHEAMGNISMPGNTSVLRYTREMRLIKEIKEWMSLLPTLPADEREKKWRTKQCNILAKHIADIHDEQIDNPWYPYQEELVKTISPILDHVLKPGHEKEYSQMIYDILKRQLDVADELYPLTQPQYTDSQNATYFDKSAALRKHYTPQEESIEYGSFSANVPHSSSITDGHARRLSKTIKPTDILFQAVEDWSKVVPIEGDEETKKSTRDRLVQALLRKVGQLNMDPNTYNDNSLYQAALTDEIEEMLDELPQNSMLQTNKERLKNKLVDDISEANAILKNMNAGENYKKKLEDNIGGALPRPTNGDQKAAIDLVKTVIAEEFILSKFQNGDDDLKSQYEDKVLSGLSNVIDASVFTHSDVSDIHDSLRSELESVPAPNNDAIALEVEEIKTKHVIAEWFEGLPLVSPRSHQEVLDRDRIQSLLAKRLHGIEKNESDPEFAMMAIITKWLYKLPFHEGQEKFVGDMTQNLIAKLRTTEDKRHATLKHIGGQNTTTDFPRYQTGRQEGIMSSTRYMAPNKTCSNVVDYTKISEIPVHQSCTDIIFERVQHWCQHLPLEGNTEEELNSELKSKLATKILFKIGELNRDDLIFNDEILYSEELAEALDKIILSLPKNDFLKNNKVTLIRNLIENIVEVRPCIREEKDRHHYKQQLYNTVTQVVKQPQNITQEQKTLTENFQEEIVDDFIEYNYHKDVQGKRFFREKILNDSQNFLRSTGIPNPQGLAAVLFQELSKVPVPTDAAVREEVQEIRLKQQISSCIQELPLPNAGPSGLHHKNKIKGVLAKRLNEIENRSQGFETQQKIRNEITKYMKKISENVNDETLSEQVNKLTDRLNRTRQERRNPKGVSAMRSNQCAQASESFFRPVASTTQFGRPGQSQTARGNQEGSVQTGPSTSFTSSAKNAHYIPCPGSIEFMGMREAYSNNQVLCPHGELYNLETCGYHAHGYAVDDGRFVACPYWMKEEMCSSDLDARFSQARIPDRIHSRCRLAKSAEKAMLSRKSHCACLDTDGLLSVVPCPIHEKSTWRQPGTCTRYPTRF